MMKVPTNIGWSLFVTPPSVFGSKTRRQYMEDILRFFHKYNDSKKSSYGIGLFSIFPAGGPVIMEGVNGEHPDVGDKKQDTASERGDKILDEMYNICDGPCLAKGRKAREVVEWKLSQQTPGPGDMIMFAGCYKTKELLEPARLDQLADALNGKTKLFKGSNKDCIMGLHSICNMGGGVLGYDTSMRAKLTIPYQEGTDALIEVIIIVNCASNATDGPKWIKYMMDDVLPAPLSFQVVDKYDSIWSNQHAKMQSLFERDEDTLKRLREMKAKYDPNNVLRSNGNILPAGQDDTKARNRQTYVFQK